MAPLPDDSSAVASIGSIQIAVSGSSNVARVTGNLSSLDTLKAIEALLGPTIPDTARPTTPTPDTVSVTRDITSLETIQAREDLVGYTTDITQRTTPTHAQHDACHRSRSPAPQAAHTSENNQSDNEAQRQVLIQTHQHISKQRRHKPLRLPLRKTASV